MEFNILKPRLVIRLDNLEFPKMNQLLAHVLREHRRTILTSKYIQFTTYNDRMVKQVVMKQSLKTVTGSKLFLYFCALRFFNGKMYQHLFKEADLSS